jgi:hypothetical protein
METVPCSALFEERNRMARDMRQLFNEVHFVTSGSTTRGYCRQHNDFLYSIRTGIRTFNI